MATNSILFIYCNYDIQEVISPLRSFGYEPHCYVASVLADCSFYLQKQNHPFSGVVSLLETKRSQYILTTSTRWENLMVRLRWLLLETYHLRNRMQRYIISYLYYKPVYYCVLSCAEITCIIALLWMII